jgi:hypothetical protein
MRNVNRIALAKTNVLCAYCDFHLSRQTDECSLLFSVLKLDARSTPIQDDPRIAKMLHGAIGGRNKDLPTLVRIGSAKYIALASDWFIQNCG